MSDDSRRLTDEEIEALSSMEMSENTSSADVSAQLGDVKAHNLATEDRTIGINLSAIDMITERFTRHLRLGLLEVLRTSPRIHINNVKTLNFGQYLQGLKPPLSVNTVRISGLRGSSLIVIDPNVIFASLDNFFGGFGRGIDGLPPGRMFTPTETRIINIMMDVIFSSLKEAWAPVMAVECEHLGSEINPQFVQIADENDLVVACHLDVELSATEKGSIDIVYPFAALKPIRDELRGRVQDSNDNAVDDGIWLNELESAASYAELETVVELGDTQLSLRQFQSLKEGDVVWFKKYDHAQLVIEGVPVFLTEVGTQHGQAAVQVVGSVPIAEKKTEKLQEK